MRLRSHWRRRALMAVATAPLLASAADSAGLWNEPPITLGVLRGGPVADARSKQAQLWQPTGGIPRRRLKPGDQTLAGNKHPSEGASPTRQRHRHLLPEA